MSDTKKLFDIFKYNPTNNITNNITKTNTDDENNYQFTTAKKIELPTTTPMKQPRIEDVDNDDETDITSLSDEQKHAFEYFRRGKNLFITGPGGVGKTHLIKHLIDYAKSENRHVPVCAMTGCAAILLDCNAKTLHSWSGIRLAKGTKDSIIKSVLRNKHAKASWQNAKGLILDEVSMLSRKIFEIIEELGRIIKRDTRPFGGMQVVFTGDFFQLPPVGTYGEPDTEQFCFESPIWSSVFHIQNHIKLTTMFRQKDPIYIEILQQIREGYIDEDKKKILQGYVKRTYDVEKMNGCVPTKLFAIRSKTDYTNNMMFKKLDEHEHVFDILQETTCKKMKETGRSFTTDEKYRCSQLNSTEKQFQLDYLINNSPGNQVLRLKKGASVMCIVNLDIDNSICNGSQGVIEDIIETKPAPTIQVRFTNGIVKNISPYYWQSEEFPCIAIGQYPLVLAWALTIHKIQGATLNMAEIDVGQSVFEYGQTYVALSRIKSLNGLYLSSFNPNKIKANPKVVEFYKKIDNDVSTKKTPTIEDSSIFTYLTNPNNAPNNDVKKIIL